MRQIEQTNQFKRDFKKIAASGRYKKKDFLDVVELLIYDKPLPEKYRDHALYNNWKSYRECHIKPDWLLIYKQCDKQLLRIARVFLLEMYIGISPVKRNYLIA